MITKKVMLLEDGAEVYAVSKNLNEMAELFSKVVF